MPIAQLDNLKDQPTLYAVGICICLVFAGFAGAVAWLDKRTAQGNTECAKKIQALEARVVNLESSIHQVRLIAVDGITETTDPRARDQFRKIATILD